MIHTPRPGGRRGFSDRFGKLFPGVAERFGRRQDRGWSRPFGNVPDDEVSSSPRANDPYDGGDAPAGCPPIPIESALPVRGEVSHS